MKIKNITIETDNGDEITMSLDECEKFFQAYRRLKEAAEPKPKQPEVWPYVPVPNTWPQQLPPLPQGAKITWTTTSGSTANQLGALSSAGCLGSLIG